MKYLDAFLRGEEISPGGRESDPTKPTKPTKLELPLRTRAWPCPHCGRQAEIEAVEPSRDGTRMLTFWTCKPCQVWAVTPNTLREPPVWASRRLQ